MSLTKDGLAKALEAIATEGNRLEKELLEALDPVVVKAEEILKQLPDPNSPGANTGAIANARSVAQTIVAYHKNLEETTERFAQDAKAREDAEKAAAKQDDSK